MCVWYTNYSLCNINSMITFLTFLYGMSSNNSPSCQQTQAAVWTDWKLILHEYCVWGQRFTGRCFRASSLISKFSRTDNVKNSVDVVSNTEILWRHRATLPPGGEYAARSPCLVDQYVVIRHFRRRIRHLYSLRAHFKTIDMPQT